ncbi:MAG: hypothetical protein F6J95_008205 [Leptolyngbya sp. SIO1E4]|nr:hypothetical protein [Leptolyngbya sp. SIO1E4]
MNPSTAPQQAHPSPTHAGALLDSLQPVLRNTLSSLNVQLEHELARYRYAKRGEAQPAPPPQLRPRRRPLELMGGRAQASPQAHPQPAPRPAVTPPPPPPNPRIQRETQTPPASVTPPVGGAIAPAASASTPASEVAALRSALVRQPEPSSEEYMASSEALLESFAQPYGGQAPETEVHPPEPNWTERFNTPLGLGALILLLVASAGFGFVLVNPAAVRHLVDRTPLARVWPAPSDETSEGDATVAASGETDPAAPSDGKPLNPLSPDLSQQEFTDLDFNSLSNLPSGATQADREALAPNPEAPEPAQPSPANNNTASAPTATSPATSPIPSTAVPVTTAPRPTPSTAAPPASTAPTPAPAASQPAPPSAPSPEPATQAAPPTAATVNEASGLPASPYYVVTDYTGDPSLSAAREVVEDAYLRNFDDGSFIQMGAFSSEDTAAALVEELENQGINAQVYNP